MAQFLRSSNVPESSLPPSLGPAPSPYPGDPQSPHPPSSSSSPGYPPHPPRDRMGPPAFHPHPGQPQYGPLAPTHGVYAPLYDSRRVWRPQVSPLSVSNISMSTPSARDSPSTPFLPPAVSQRGRQEQLAATGGAALLRLPASTQGEIQLSRQQLLLRRRAPSRPAQGG